MTFILLQTNGDYFEYSFKGTGVEIIAPTDPSQGEIDVYVDNAFKGTVSLTERQPIVPSDGVQHLRFEERHSYDQRCEEFGGCFHSGRIADFAFPRSQISRSEHYSVWRKGAEFQFGILPLCR